MPSGGNFGVQVAPPILGSYLLRVNLRLSAAVSANSLIWAFRMGATRTGFIKMIVLSSGVDPTTAVASRYVYELVRFSGANPTGGTALTVVKSRSSYSASNVQDARFNDAAALTVTGITFETAFCHLTGARVNSSAVSRVVTLEDPFELLPNEGFGIRLTNASIIGDFLSGSVAWEER